MRDDDDDERSLNYVTDLICPICGNVTRAFYKSYDGTNSKDKPKLFAKRWYFHNFLRHVKGHLARDLAADPKVASNAAENPAIVEVLTRKRKGFSFDLKQPKIDGKFDKIEKNIQQGDLEEEVLEQVDLLESEVDDKSDGNSDSDDQPLIKKSKPNSKKCLSSSGED